MLILVQCFERTKCLLLLHKFIKQISKVYNTQSRNVSSAVRLAVRRLVLSGEEETRICRIKSRMRMKSSSGVVRYGGINLRQRRNTGCLAETRYRFLYLFVYDESFLRLYTMDITSIEMYITEMCIAYFFFFLIRGSRDVIYPIVYVYDIRWQPVDYD